MLIIQKRSAQPDLWPAIWPANSSGIDTVEDSDLEQPVSQQQVRDFVGSNEQSRVLTGFDTWFCHREVFVGVAEVGVVVDTSIDLNLFDHGINELSLIKVVFKGFNDGKGYSIASILRTQHNYQGELRAANVVKENLALLEQCGFDSYEMVEGTDLEQAISVFDQLVPNAAA